MNKQPDDMKIEELGNLFPVIISEPDPDWIKVFQKEETKIKRVLDKQNIISVEHIGSTAVPDLKAKPTIDILIEVPVSADKELIIANLIKLNYHYIPRPENPAPHMMFVKGYTPAGFKGQTYHIHVRYSGDCKLLPSFRPLVFKYKLSYLMMMM